MVALLLACHAVDGAEVGADAGFFSLARVHTLELEVSSLNLASLRAMPTTWVPADLTIDGAAPLRVAVRVKGRSGSFRTIDEKPGLKIDLDREVDGQRVEGLARMDLENLVVDCSAARERLAWEAIAAVGVPGVQLAYTELTLNGAPYGLYGVIADADAVFLAGHYADPSGNLYDGDYVQLDDGFETNVDFDATTQDWFELDEGHDVGRADIHAVTSALDAAEAGEAWASTVDTVVDTDALVAELAAEAWLGQVDGYGLQANNYRVYFAPGARMGLVPWDMDFTFIDPAEWESDWHAPVGRLAVGCLADDTCAQRFAEQLDATATAIDARDLSAELDQVAALVADAVARDPKRECSVEEHEGDVVALHAWIDGRSTQVRQEWGMGS